MCDTKLKQHTLGLEAAARRHNTNRASGNPLDEALQLATTSVTRMGKAAGMNIHADITSELIGVCIANTCACTANAVNVPRTHPNVPTPTLKRDQPRFIKYGATNPMLIQRMPTIPTTTRTYPPMPASTDAWLVLRYKHASIIFHQSNTIVQSCPIKALLPKPIP